MTWDTLTADPEDCTLACSLEIHGSRLKGIVQVVDLLSEVKGVVDTVRPTTPAGRWRRDCKEVALDVVAGALYGSRTAHMWPGRGVSQEYTTTVILLLFIPLRTC